MRDRLMQLACVLIAAAALFGGSRLLPEILRISDEKSLRYTDVSV